MSSLNLYFLLVFLPNFKQFFMCLWWLCVLVVIVHFVLIFAAWSEGDDDTGRRIFKRILTWLIVGLIFLALTVPIPSKEQVIEIVGIKYISNSKQIASIPENTAKVLNRLLTDYINKHDKTQVQSKANNN